MNCPQCGAVLEGNNATCPQCEASKVQVDASQEVVAPETPQTNTPPASSGLPIQSEQQAQPAAPSGQPVMPAQPNLNQEKKSKKARNIIIGVVVAVLVLAAVVVGVVVMGEAAKANSYDNGVALMQGGEYAKAEDVFKELDDYEDSKQLVSYCQDAQDYEAAMTLKEAGDYEGAKTAFTKLYDFEDSQEQVKTCQYTLAEGLIEEGRNEAAYNAFMEIQEFNDSLERAEACIVAFPATSEINRNGDFIGYDGILTIDSDDASSPTYIKIYSGDAVVSIIALQPQDKISLDFPAGDYVIKLATGENWFGEEDLFGEAGYYGGGNPLDTGSTDLAIDRGYEHFLSIYDTTSLFNLGGGNASSF